MADREYQYQAVDPFTGETTGKKWTEKVPSHEDSFATTGDHEEVPTGTIAEVEAWVDDPDLSDAVRSDRAKAALLAEQSRGPEEQRKTLIASLTGRITG